MVLMTVSLVLSFLVAVVLVAVAFRKVVATNAVHVVQSSNKTVSYGKGMSAGNVYYKWPSFLPF